ncbi:MAG: biopolymer transporter ExbD [Spongiibacteraceae bacterium]|nr:biopolymer transporter ExbD [Spongiibacteraceae bacterium]
MKFRRQKAAPVDLNITPLIDMVFLLLIFFMVSTTFTKESRLGLDLPEANGEPASALAQQVEVIVSANGNYVVNERPLINNQLATLKAALQEVAAGDLSQPLVITADATAEHQAVVRAMDAAGQVGFVHLSLTTRQPEE